MITPEKYVERLIEVSSKKSGILKELLDLTIQQSQVITEDTTDQLNALILEKQGRIDSIDKLDEEFNIYFERLKYEAKVKSLDELQPDSIKGIRELKLCIAGIMKIIGEIRELEKENNDKAQMLLEDIGKEIRKINQSKNVNKLYSSPYNQTVSYYIDKKK